MLVQKVPNKEDINFIFLNKLNHIHKIKESSSIPTFCTKTLFPKIRYYSILSHLWSLSCAFVLENLM